MFIFSFVLLLPNFQSKYFQFFRLISFCVDKAPKNGYYAKQIINFTEVSIKMPPPPQNITNYWIMLSVYEVVWCNTNEKKLPSNINRISPGLLERHPRPLNEERGVWCYLFPTKLEGK